LINPTVVLIKGVPAGDNSLIEGLVACRLVNSALTNEMSSKHILVALRLIKDDAVTFTLQCRLLEGPQEGDGLLNKLLVVCA
jgi:hypothetical protein